MLLLLQPAWQQQAGVAAAAHQKEQQHDQQQQHQQPQQQQQQQQEQEQQEGEKGEVTGNGLPGDGRIIHQIAPSDGAHQVITTAPLHA